MDTAAATRFVADSGREVPAVTADCMREIDRIAAEETGPNLFQMMENAGRNLAELVLERLGSRWRAARIVVLAGGGGNGGGGICAARHLANRGADVTVVLAEPQGLTPLTAWQHMTYGSTDGRSETRLAPERQAVDLVVDALIGYGLRHAPESASRDLIRWANESRATLVALDVPSGLDATTGATPGEAVCAQVTMTLALPKTGLRAPGVGELELADLGMPADTFRRAGVVYVPPFGNRFRIPLRSVRGPASRPAAAVTHHPLSDRLPGICSSAASPT
jgi:NAD(P)H-hydrate epimerase